MQRYILSQYLGGGHVAEPELDYLSNIVKVFNDLFGSIEWKDGDKNQESHYRGDTAESSGR